jgi:hypothetical protein
MPQFKDEATIRHTNPGTASLCLKEVPVVMAILECYPLPALNESSAAMGYSYFGIATALREPRSWRSSRKCIRYC